MATRELFNANTQQLEEAELSVDANNEIVATFTDGSVLKFPAGLTSKQLDKLAETHHTANDGKEIVTDEMEKANAAERAASFELIGETDPEQRDVSDVPEGEVVDQPTE